ncbi:uncharacterized protein A4U43_C04F10840 [Asparagus officinalis]|uniref:Uncharacterized protein n=1 Tax=Asparagus officinalis TaxID=4686 RepID=A0A5P1F1Q7_ASPOF|nr:WD repeat-containing protein 76-like [Asparagus officinalis]XP_020260730.1 WD repeat-containing protein 76-like [Asparagus officinalis]XP_020260731.1 WD repeat-containing protein 76-like [Asparagus officinalis]ONK71643.1 uncharacterized protein A4U43_C04F10840 [Asparagus officinalis]
MSPETLTDYERRRQENIRRNAEMMETLRLQRTAADLHSLRPRRTHHQKKPSSSSRQSLRIRGKSPERYPKFTDLDDLALTLTPSPSNPQLLNPLIDVRFDPRSSMLLKPENSAVILTKIISCLRFLPFNDRTVVVAGNAVGDLGFWVVDSFNGKGLYSCSLHSNLVTGISAHHSSPAKIFTSSYDRFVRLMDVEHENSNVIVCSSGSDPFYSICQWPEDVSSLYIGEGVGKLKVWDEKAGKASSFWEMHGGRINSIDFSLVNSHLMATSSSDGMACIWDLRFMKRDRPECLNRVVHERAINSAYFSPSGSCLATTSDDDRVGILSGGNFDEQCMIPHKNRGAKFVSSTRGIWGWSDSYLFLGNLEGAIDVICIGNKTTMALESLHMSLTPQHLAAHPYKLGSLAAATGGGKVFLWSSK